MKYNLMPEPAAVSNEQLLYLLKLEDHIQQVYNRITYDRSLSKDEIRLMSKSLPQLQSGLQAARKEVANGL